MSIPATAAINAYTKMADLAAKGPDKNPAEGATAQNFGATLQGVVDDMMQTGKVSEAQTAAAVAGKADVVDVVTAVAEAETTLEMVVTVRDRVVNAYQEILRMPI